MLGSYDSVFAHAGATPYTVLPQAFIGFSFWLSLTFPFTVGVILCRHSWADEDRDWIADAVQTEGGPGPHQSRGPPQASDLLVSRRNCPVVFDRCRTGHDAQELLRGEERFCCSHYIDWDTMLQQKNENLSEKCYPSTVTPSCQHRCIDPKMSQNWDWCLPTLNKFLIYYKCWRWDMLRLISLSTNTERDATLWILFFNRALKFLWINVQKL